MDFKPMDFGQGFGGLSFGDNGFDLDLGGLDLGGLRFTSEMEQTRYIAPRIAHYNEERFVRYDNALALARALRVTEGMRADVFLAGSFIFGDFIEAFLITHRAQCRRMLISTLSVSQENVDSRETLLVKGWVDELTLVISVYFWGHERNGLIPYIYEHLDVDDKFQLCVAGCHTKTCSFETYGGKKICIHGSANLRSSGSIEQVCIEENPELYDFWERSYARSSRNTKPFRSPCAIPKRSG